MTKYFLLLNRSLINCFLVVPNQIPFVAIHDIDLHLADIYHDTSWDFARLATLLPAELKAEFNNIFIDEDSLDRVIWRGASNGCYLASSGYTWLSRMEHQVQQPVAISWSWIWRLSLAKNVKHFLWLAYHGNLPTNLSFGNPGTSLIKILLVLVAVHLMKPFYIH